MESIWKRKWIIVIISAAIVVAVGAVGAVALADPGDEVSATPLLSGQFMTATSLQSTADTQAGKAFREARRARLQERLERIKQRWLKATEHAKGQMTPEDRTKFDSLQQTAEQQRAALKQARQNLQETLKQLRELVKKYRPQPTTTTTQAPSGQVQ